MKNSKERKQNLPKSNSIYFFVAIAALFLSWFINRDMAIPSPVIIVAGVFSCFLLLFLGVRKPEIPFYVLVAYLPFNKIISGTFGGFMTALNLTNILIFIVILCWIVHGMSNKQKIFEYNGLNWLIIIFCLFGVFSVVRGSFYYGAQYLNEFIFPLKRWLTPIFLYFLALNIVKNKDIFKNVVIIIMIVVTVAGLFTLKQAFDIGDQSNLDDSRVGGLAQQPNMMGAFFVYYMFLFLGFFYLNWKKFKSWFLLVPFVICLRGIQVTFSRGALMAFTFGLAATTFFKNKFIFAVMCFGILFALFNPQWLPGSMRYAIERTKGGDQIYESASIEDTLDKSAATRVEIWRGAADMIKENPWWGVGYGMFHLAIPRYAPQVGEIDAHNTYVIIAAEMGIPVLVLFVLILFVLFRNAFWLFTRVEDKFIKAVALGVLGGLASMLVANMFGSRMNSEEISSYFWVLTGLVIRAVIMKRRKEII